MKLIGTLLLVFLNYLSFSQKNSDDKKIVFEGKNYKIQYPQDWRLDTSKRMGTELFVFAALENAEDKFAENVNVLIQDLSQQNIDLEKYKQITEKQLAEMVTDGKIFESTIIKPGNKNYYRITYTMPQEKFRLKITSFCFIKDEKAYLVTFSAELDKYDHYKNIGEAILASFDLAN